MIGTITGELVVFGVVGWYAAAVVAVLWTTTTVSRRSKRIRRPKILGRFLCGTAVVSTNVDSISGFMGERVVHTLGFIILDSLLSFRSWARSNSFASMLSHSQSDAFPSLRGFHAPEHFSPSVALPD